MKRALHTLVCVFLAALAAGSADGVAPRQDTPRTADRPARREGDAAREAARRRWAELTPVERERMRQRYERLQELTPEQRERMTQRAHRLNEMRRRLWRALEPATRERLEALPAPKRLELLDEMLVDEVEDAAERIIERLSPAERERLERATPLDRVRFLTERKRRADEGAMANARRLAAELGLERPDFERLRELPPAARQARMQELLRAGIEHAVAQQGLPRGVNAEAWERLRALPDDEFFAAVVRLRRSHPHFGRMPFGAERRQEQWRKRDALRRAMQPTPEDRLELAELTPEARREEMQERRRARALEVVRREALVPAERLQELENLPPPRFFRALRSALDGPRPPR